MDIHGRQQQAIIQENLGAGNDLELAEIVAAYDIIYQRFHSGSHTSFYSPDAVSSVQSITDLRPSIRRMIERNSTIDPRAAEFLASYADLMRRQGLPFILSSAHLHKYLDVNGTELEALRKNIRKQYHTTEIPKKHGGFRTIDAPNEKLKSVQSAINNRILKYVQLNKAATGFRKGKSIKDNAEKHQKKFAVYGLDLENFFHSISGQRVFSALTNLGFPRGVAVTITDICCLNGRLPMGAPTSPALANIVASRLDRRLVRLAAKERAAYTRYADDITFSFKSRSGLRIIPLVKEIIASEGFTINKAKEELSFRHQRQYVTGLVVNEKTGIKKTDYRRLRAAIHNAKTKSVHSAMEAWGAGDLASFRAQLSGHINFVAMINKEKSERLRDEFNKISWQV